MNKTNMTATFEKLKLASAGNDIKVWDTVKFSMCCSFPSNCAPFFRSVRWSSDCSSLVSTPSVGKSVLLTSVRGNSLIHRDVCTGEDNTVACFSNAMQRYLGIGTKSGKVIVWDSKLRKPEMTFSSEKSEVSCLQFNWEDKYIAAGFCTGKVVFMNNHTGQSISSLTCSANHTVRSLQYSYAKKYLLACASDDGTVHLWNSTTGQMFHNFKSVHVASATGVSFSPTNDLLLTSVGLDKKIVCYDTKAKEAVRTIECDVPLTCVDFKEDGVTLAAGSMRGSVLIYDLRNMIYPFHTISAHSSSVNALCFQNTIVAAAVRKRVMRKNAKSEVKSTELPKNTEVEDNGASQPSASAASTSFEIPTAVATPAFNRASLTTEIFSPLGNGPETTSTTSSQDTKSSEDADVSILMSKSKKSLPRKNSLAVVFSPLEEPSRGEKRPTVDISGDAAKLSFTEMPSTSCGASSLPIAENEQKMENVTIRSKQSRTKSLSPTTLCSPGKWPSDKLSSAAASNCMPDLSCLSFKGVCSSGNGNTDPNAGDGQKPSSVTNGSYMSMKPVTVTPPSLEENKTFDVSNPEMGKSYKEGMTDSAHSPDFVDEGRGTAGTTPLTPQSFQSEYIRQIILDAMEEHTDALRQDFHAYHVQMARQMEKQKEEMEALFKKYSVDADLMLQLVNLRKENDFLKHIFR